MKKEYHPPHLYYSDKIYFITCRTIHRIKYFSNDGRKRLLWIVIKEAERKFNIKLFGYVILSNHYHLLLQSEYLINKIIQFINSKSAINLNKFDKISGRKIWYQYWDRCIRSKKDFYLRLNYIHQNPVKHKETKDLYAYKFSSIKNYQVEYGKQWLNSCFRDYPVVDFVSFGE